LGGGAAAQARRGEGVPGRHGRARGDGVHRVVRDGLPGGQGGLRDRPASVRLVPLPVARRLRVRDANAKRARERRLGGVRARDAGDGEGDRRGAHSVPSSGIQLRVWVSRAGKKATLRLAWNACAVYLAAERLMVPFKLCYAMIMMCMQYIYSMLCVTILLRL
jgi:hypothetical protein